MAIRRKQQNAATGETIGSLQIDDSVVAIIAAEAALSIQGVVEMSAGIVGGIVEKLGKKNTAKGVKFEMVEDAAIIDLYIVVEFGNKIPDIALDVQKAVKNAIENTTGIKVTEINVHVQGIYVREL